MNLHQLTIYLDQLKAVQTELHNLNMELDGNFQIEKAELHVLNARNALEELCQIITFIKP